MLKRTIVYDDYDGNEVSEDFYFHLSQAELVEIELSHQGGLSNMLKIIIAKEDGATIIREFKKIILGAYGVRSDDGKRFMKSQQLREEFEASEAYSTLFIELVTDASAAADFVNGIVPAKLAARAAEVAATKNAQIRQAREMSLKGIPILEIARRFGLDESDVRELLQEKISEDTEEDVAPKSNVEPQIITKEAYMAMPAEETLALASKLSSGEVVIGE